MWQREDKQLELQAARDAEPIKQLKVERMMWLEQQEKVTTMQSGQCTGGTGEKKKNHTQNQEQGKPEIKQAATQLQQSS